MRFIIVNTANCCTFRTDLESDVIDYSIVNDEFTVIDIINESYKEYYHGCIFEYNDIKGIKND